MRMYKILHEGDVTRPTERNLMCSGSRTARIPDGRYICVYNAESASGVNDFVPMVTYSDDGLNWEESRAIWPELAAAKSISVSVRNTDNGGVSICGWATDIAYEGELWWSDEKSAMKENQLVYTISDDGYDFPPLKWIDLPYYGAAEIPGGMQVDRDGTIIIVYSPYSTIEGRDVTDTNCLVRMVSRDGGETFESSKIAVVDGESLYAETWVATLPSGARMITTWQTASQSEPDQYLYAKDGEIFDGPLALPFKGQSTALTVLPNGRVMIPYNQRKESPIGVWLAVARPDETGLNLIENAPLWQAENGTRGDTSGDFGDWTSFSFGEPHVLQMNDGTFLLVYWRAKNGVNGIGYLHFAYVDDN
jgi:hypothetical protein